VCVERSLAAVSRHAAARPFPTTAGLTTTRGGCHPTGGLMSKGHVLAQYWQFLREQKKYWMLPILAFVVLLLLIIFAESTPLAPFIYTLF
jgi:hypothetical protein